MMDLINNIVSFFLTFEDQGTGKKKAKVHHRGMLALLTSMIAVFVVWAFGIFPEGSGFVLAADFKNEISKQVEPISKKVGDIDQKLAIQGDSINEVLAALTAEKINATKRRICKAADPQERSSLALDLNEHLKRYARLSGTSYTVPSCGEL